MPSPRSEFRIASGISSSSEEVASILSGDRRLCSMNRRHDGSVLKCHSPGYRKDALLLLLYLAGEHQFDRRNDEIRLLKLDVMAAVGGCDMDAVRGDAC